MITVWLPWKDLLINGWVFFKTWARLNMNKPSDRGERHKNLGRFCTVPEFN